MLVFEKTNVIDEVRLSSEEPVLAQAVEKAEVIVEPSVLGGQTVPNLVGSTAGLPKESTVATEVRQVDAFPHVVG